MTFRSSAVIPPLRTSSLPAVAAIAIVRTPQDRDDMSHPRAPRKPESRPRGCLDGNIAVKSRPIRLSARPGVLVAAVDFTIASTCCGAQGSQLTGIGTVTMYPLHAIVGRMTIETPNGFGRMRFMHPIAGNK